MEGRTEKTLKSRRKKEGKKESKKERKKEGRKERMTEQQHWIFITEHVLQRKTYRDKAVEKKE